MDAGSQLGLSAFSPSESDGSSVTGEVTPTSPDFLSAFSHFGFLRLEPAPPAKPNGAPYQRIPNVIGNTSVSNRFIYAW